MGNTHGDRRFGRRIEREVISGHHPAIDIHCQCNPRAANGLTMYIVYQDDVGWRVVNLNDRERIVCARKAPWSSCKLVLRLLPKASFPQLLSLRYLLYSCPDSRGPRGWNFPLLALEKTSLTTFEWKIAERSGKWIQWSR